MSQALDRALIVFERVSKYTQNLNGGARADAEPKKRFDFLYYTENDDDDGYRVIEAATMDEAKLEFKRQMQAEGTHGAYRVSAIQGQKARKDNQSRADAISTATFALTSVMLRLAQHASKKHATRKDDANFIESEHPRAEDGRFGNKAGASAAQQPANGAQQPGNAAPAANKPATTANKGTQATTVAADGTRTMADGSPLAPHLAAMKIPPAWRDVKVDPDPAADLMVVGKDSKGRRTTIYNPEFMDRNSKAKFARIKELAQKFNEVSAQNDEARRSPDKRKAEAADCLALIMKMGIRPGSDKDTGAKEKAYGATTLKGEHVDVAADGSVRLKFTGKKGVALNLPVQDPDIASMLKTRKAAAGVDGKLFNINESTLLDHTHSLDGGGFKTKDMRTMLGTSTAMEQVARTEPPKTAKEYKTAVMNIAKLVSNKLGNTPTVALQSYISPDVFAEWKISEDA